LCSCIVYSAYDMDHVSAINHNYFYLKSHLFHILNRSNVTEYSFYNCIRYRNAKTRQSICSNQQVVWIDANCVANAKIKYSWLVLPMQKNTICFVLGKVITHRLTHDVEGGHQTSKFSFWRVFFNMTFLCCVFLVQQQLLWLKLMRQIFHFAYKIQQNFTI